MGVGAGEVGPGISGTTSGGGGGSGTVTSVSVATANGFAGTVANPTTTPAITLSTTITGLLKGNGTAISAAVAGTDYLTPTGSGAALTGVVYSITADDASIVVNTASGNANIETGTLDAIATAQPPVAAVPFNAQKITGLANGSAATDGAAFGQIPVVVVSAYTLSTITADPNPGVKGTYYRFNYAATGNFTLPTSPTTGAWIKIKNVSTTATCNIVGTVDGITTFTIPPLGANEFVYNGTSWDAN